MAIKKLVAKFYETNDVGYIFGGHELKAYVLKRLSGKDCYTETCLRKMRDLKQEGKINFACIDNQKSLYQKLEIGADQKQLGAIIRQAKKTGMSEYYVVAKTGTHSTVAKKKCLTCGKTGLDGEYRYCPYCGIYFIVKGGIK